jgi:endonuclease/exonuclease/phosphatase family metal-dependent hydrolase
MSDLSQPQPHAGMRLATWNILHGESIPPRPGQKVNLGGLADYIAAQIAPDVIGLQEADYLQPRSSDLKQVEELAGLLGGWHWGFAATVHGTPGEKWRKHHHHETKHFFSHGGGANSDDVGASGDTSVVGFGRDSDGTESPQYGIGLISKIEVTKWHVLELGRSRIGMPLLIPVENPKTGKPGARFIYVKDEPRVALAAELANGVTVVVTHLSFVPLVNLWQLWRAKRWLSRLSGTHILLGDFNIPVPALVRSKKWKSLHAAKSYPSWGAKVKFDYIIGEGVTAKEITELPHSGYSDHLPLVVELIP